MRGIDGGTRLAGVIGWPIGHSLSPVLHGHWFARAGVAGFYVPLAVRPEDFEEAFAALPKLGFAGVNVTIPHKQRAFALVDEADETAERMGAVNTVLIDAEGRRLGRNTDGYGFLANLESRAPGWRDVVGTGRGRPAVIVGTGGAARAVACSLIEARIGHVRLINRTRAHAEELAAALASWSDARVEVVDWEDREAALGGAGLAVNGTSLGMNGQPPLDLALDALPTDAVVADLVYVPLWTPLLRAARLRGLRTVDGLGMLLHQAAPGFRHWGGSEPAVDEATRALLLERLGG